MSKKPCFLALFGPFLAFWPKWRFGFCIITFEGEAGPCCIHWSECSKNYGLHGGGTELCILSSNTEQGMKNMVAEISSAPDFRLLKALGLLKPHQIITNDILRVIWHKMASVEATTRLIAHLLHLTQWQTGSACWVKSQ